MATSLLAVGRARQRGALWWRRRIPVIVTLVGIAVFAITQWSPVVMCVGLLSLAVRRRDRVLAAMTLAVAGTFAFVMHLGDDHGWAEAIVVGGGDRGVRRAGRFVRRGPPGPGRLAA